MLVLSRKVGEKIVVGDGIVLTVVAVKGGTVRLGVEAPPSTPIWREEIAPNRASAKTDEPAAATP